MLGFSGGSMSVGRSSGGRSMRPGVEKNPLAMNPFTPGLSMGSKLQSPSSSPALTFSLSESNSENMSSKEPNPLNMSSVILLCSSSISRNISSNLIFFPPIVCLGSPASASSLRSSSGTGPPLSGWACTCLPRPSRSCPCSSASWWSPRRSWGSSPARSSAP